jgi:hypothetical protein
MFLLRLNHVHELLASRSSLDQTQFWYYSYRPDDNSAPSSVVRNRRSCYSLIKQYRTTAGPFGQIRKLHMDQLTTIISASMVSKTLKLEDLNFFGLNDRSA